MTQQFPFILYLDYDGVLHPDEVFLHVKYPHIRLKAPGHALFEHTPVLERILEPYPEVKLVLATSWVATFDFRRALKRLSKPLQARVIGATYHTRAEYSLYEFKQMSRYQQIIRDVLRRRPLRWLALDNAIEHWPSAARHLLVATPDFEALGCAAAQSELTEKLKQLCASVSAEGKNSQPDSYNG